MRTTPRRDANLEALGSYYDDCARELGVRTAEDFVPPTPTMERRRRRRRRGEEDRTSVMTLVETEDGVLRWDVGGARRAALRRRAGRAARAGLFSWLTGREKPVKELHFELLPPNEIVAAISALDRRFAAVSLARDAKGEPSFGLRRVSGDQLVPVAAPAAVGKGKRILLLVHGTFSNCDHMLEELRSTVQGQALLASKRFDEVLVFDHPTLACSPMLNAFELSRALRGVAAEICVIAHSRGGLVTRWWLEGFGGAGDGPRKAVLVGSPLAGTSLASPARIREAMDLLTNFGNALKLAGAAASSFAPLLAAPVVLLKVFTSITSALSKLPIADAGIAMVPGLAGQSRAGNNPELLRLRASRPAKLGSYSVIRSNFETEAAGWKFWKLFRKDKLLDTGADALFPSRNDLVVDTDSMDDVFAAGDLARSTVIHEWARSPTVHHTNYFRQRETIDAIAGVL